MRCRISVHVARGQTVRWNRYGVPLRDAAGQEKELRGRGKIRTICDLNRFKNSVFFQASKGKQYEDILMTNDPADAPRLRRSLTLWNLVIIGIVIIQPIAPMGIFGVV